MIKRMWTGALLFTVFFTIASAGYGDVVKLKNGIILTGDVIMETENEIVIKMVKYGEGRIKKFAISSIEYTGVPEVNYSVVSNGVTREVKQEPGMNTNAAGEKKPGNSEETKNKSDSDFHISFGLNEGFFPMWWGFSTQDTDNIGITTKTGLDFDPLYFMNTSFFIDIMFLRFDIGYGFVMFTNTGSTFTMSQSVAGIPLPLFSATNRQTMSYNYSYLSLSLLFMLPSFSKSPISTWPAVGVEYDFALTYKINGMDMMTYKDANLNNFWILAGYGMTVKIGEHFSIVPSIVLGYNLTAAPYRDTDTDPFSLTKSFADVKLFAYGIKINVNIGFAFVL